MNVYDSNDTQTSSHIDGWHNKLKKAVGKAHPNFYEIVQVFKKEQASAEVTITQLASGGQPPTRTIQNDKKIAELQKGEDYPYKIMHMKLLGTQFLNI